MWNRVRDVWQSWFSPSSRDPARIAIQDNSGEGHLELARESLRDLLHDERVPAQVRQELADDYAQVQRLLERLEHEQIQVAVFGRVSVGKSAILNALLGHSHFSTSPLHGETKSVAGASWTEYAAGNVQLVDTPGIDEVGGEARERLASEVAEHSDLVLFVVDGDITATELEALRQLKAHHGPVILVLNKADRYSNDDREALLQSLARKCDGVVSPEHVVAASAAPAPRVVIRVNETGEETESEHQPKPDVEALRDLLWSVLEAEGKSLAAVNAGLFAGKLSDQVAGRLLEVRREVAERVVRSYSLGKGLGVALNPIPVADLLALAADGAMIVHLSKVYGLPITRKEAGQLIRTIAGQITLLMGTVWGVSLVSSALKGVSLGLSTVLTAAAQGAVAYYGTYVVGRAAERYFAQGQSWGPGGAKQAVKEILDGIDSDSLLSMAREDILARLKTRQSTG